MKALHIFLISLAISFSSQAEHINKQAIKVFAKEIMDLTFDNPNRLPEFVSKDLEVELHIGSSIQGFSLFYNYQQFIRALKKSSTEEEGSFKDLDIYRVKATSFSDGEFKAVYYSTKLKVKVWEQYFVRLEEGKMKIIKVISHIS